MTKSECVEYIVIVLSNYVPKCHVGVVAIAVSLGGAPSGAKIPPASALTGGPSVRGASD